MNSTEDRPHPQQHQPVVGVVGVCAAGKSTLITGLKKHGIHTKHIAQEHSYVQDMWKRLTNPYLLIFLDASYPVTLVRRQLNWSKADWGEQQRRLRHAREHADLYILTDGLSIEQVLQSAIDFIEQF
jgi:hypothetical protein